MEQEIPREMDGKVLLDLFERDFKNKREVTYGHRSLAVDRELLKRP